jgi:hypothetical protein
MLQNIMNFGIQNLKKKNKSQQVTMYINHWVICD